MNSKQIKFKGTIFIILSAFFFGTYGTWSKMMSGIFDDFFQSWTRSLIVIGILLPIAFITKKLRKIEKEDWKWILIYSVPGALGVPALFYAFTKLSVGTTLLLFYSMITISAYVYGMIAFKEKMNKVKIISLLLGILGLVIMYSLNLKEGIFPMIIASIAGICAGTEVNFTKKLSNRYSPEQLAIIVYIVCFIITLPIFLILKGFTFNIDSNLIAWIANFAYAVSSLIAFMFVVKGFKNLEPSIAGILGLLEVPIGILLAFIIFKEPISIAVIIGGTIIIFACMLPNLTDILKERKENKIKKAENKKIG